MKQLIFILISFFFAFNLNSQVCFGPAQRITHLENNYSLLVISFDVDGDSDIDIVSLEDGNTMYWYENDGMNNYINKNEIITSYTIDILVSSNNNSGDNFLDLFVRESGPTGSLHNLTNDGTGVFTEASVNVPSNGLNISTKDVTGDEYSEVAIIDQQNLDMYDGISFWEMSSTGEFQNENYINIPNMLIDCILLEDVDNDDDNDVIVSVQDMSSSEYYLLLKRNDGTGNFGIQDTIVTEINNDLYTLSAADIDGDNNIDIISYVENKIVWYKNDGTGNFNAQQTIFDFGSYNSYFIEAIPVDIDGDNDIDIISNTENNVVYYENTDGNGTFSGEKIICTLTSVKAINATDFDQDGDFDLLIASMEGAYLFENNPEVFITIQPENINAVEGENVSISVQAIGRDLLYQWQLNSVNISNGGNISGTDSPSISINPITLSDVGNYKCQITGTCHEIYSAEVELLVSASSISAINKNSYNIYPNPTGSILYITSENLNSFNIIISDVFGKIILIDSFPGNRTERINLTDISKGIYFITIKTDDDTISKKIILK